MQKLALFYSKTCNIKSQENIECLKGIAYIYICYKHSYIKSLLFLLHHNSKCWLNQHVFFVFVFYSNEIECIYS